MALINQTEGAKTDVRLLALTEHEDFAAKAWITSGSSGMKLYDIKVRNITVIIVDCNKWGCRFHISRSDSSY